MEKGCHTYLILRLSRATALSFSRVCVSCSDVLMIAWLLFGIVGVAFVEWVVGYLDLLVLAQVHDPGKQKRSPETCINADGAPLRLSSSSGSIDRSLLYLQSFSHPTA
jgi:hypothetical protein